MTRIDFYTVKDVMRLTCGGEKRDLKTRPLLAGERGLMRATLFDTNAGLRTDKLRAEFLTLQLSFG